MKKFIRFDTILIQKGFVFLLALSFLGLFQLPVKAQTVSPAPIDSVLKLKIEEVGQEYPSRKFQVQLTIDSTVSSGKVEIVWNYPQELLMIEGSRTDVYSVVANSPITIDKYFIPYPVTYSDSAPLFARYANINVDVKAFVPERNYYNTESVLVEFDSEMEVQPVHTEYQRSKMLYIVWYWVSKVMVVLIILLVIGIAIKKFLNYLNSDEAEY